MLRHYPRRVLAALRTHLIARRHPGTPLSRPPRLTVIMPAYNVAGLVESSMRSVLGQSLKDIELVVIDDGSSDETLAVIKRVAAEDPRVRVFSQPNAGLSATRNRGIELAHGTYVAFIDSDDLVEPTAFQTLVEGLHESGSDLAVASYRHLRGKSLLEPGVWIRELHATKRLGVRLAELPQLLDNALACSKVFRREFLLDEQIRFPVGVLYEDQQTTAIAYSRARAIDVHAIYLLRWRLRDDGASITQQSASSANLAARAAAVRASLAVLQDNGQDEALRYRRVSYLANNTFTLRHLVRDDAQYWRVLRDIVTELLEQVDPELFTALVSPQDRLIYWLVKQNLRAEALAVVRAGGLNINHVEPYRDEEGRVRYHFPGVDITNVGLPEHFQGPSERDTRLQPILTGVEITADELRLRGAAYVPNVPQDDLGEPRVELRGAGARIPLMASSTVDVGAQTRTRNRTIDYTASGFTAAIPLETLITAAQSTGTGRFRVAVTRTTCNLERSALITKSESGGGAHRAVHREIADGLVLLALPSSRGTVVELRRNLVRLRSVKVEDGTLELQITQAPARVLVLKVGDEEGSALATIEVRRPEGGWQEGARASLPWPVSSRCLRVTFGRKTGRPLLPWLDPQDVLLRGQLVNRSTVVLSVRAEQPRLVDAALEGSELLLDLEHPGRLPAIRLVGVTRTLLPAEVVHKGERHKLRIPLVQEEREGWTFRTAPRGTYQVLAGADGAGVPVVNALEVPLPCHLKGSVLNATVMTTPTGNASVRLVNPVPAEQGTERYRARQEKLVRIGAEPSRPTVYLQCLAGDQVADTQLALARYLEKHRPEITVVWGVRDLSHAVPESQERVILASPEYFETLRAARWLVYNHELPRWIGPRDKQVVVQTYHGHPFKAMGMSRWATQSVTPAQVEAALDMRRCWDLLLSPSPTATRLYRENFPLDYEVVEAGHPRNDRLATASEEERAAVRTALGIPEGKRAVLYAPTYRDSASTTAWVSPPVDFIDPDELSAMLGEEYVVLWRGHPAHRRYSEKYGRVTTSLDVSDYEDVNDLIIASDVGLFDYSSIRFDYSVTRKPMVFLAPDEDEYFALYPPLLPYRSTAPGPVVRDRSEVAEAIRGILVSPEPFQAEYEQFVATFNPWDDGQATARLFAAMEQAYARKLARSPVEVPRA